MVKDLFRIVGAACILTGIFLYFSFQTEADSELLEKNEILNQEIGELQLKLKKTEEELAHLQTLRTEAELPENNEDSEDVDDEQNTTTEDEVQAKQITLLIEAGTTSKDVANELESAGIIEDAATLNLYLKDNHLEKSIQIGEYQVEETMSIETIAQLITKTP